MLTYIDDLRNGLHDLFFENEKAILIGEDVLDPYGGAFKVTAGLSSKYPDRVITSPISEAGIVGVGAGLALRGYSPLIEIMFGDFMTLCVDQLVNHASKFPLMYDGAECPLVVRTPMGAGRGYGPTHSQTLEKMFLGIPGLTIVAPGVVHRPGAILKHIVNNYRKPTIFIENKMLYGEFLAVSSDKLNIEHVVDTNGFHVSIVKNYKKNKPDVCVIAYGGASKHLPEILEDYSEEEINVLAIIPECIDPLPSEILNKYIDCVDKYVVLDDGWSVGSWSDSVARMVYEFKWNNLAAPIKILATPNLVIPTSAALERGIVLGKEKIENAIMEVLEW